MAGLAYRVWFGDRSATKEELDRIEEIVVEQEMDMAWEARIRMYVCLDEKGHWQHGADGFAKPFERVRVEIGFGSPAYTPLIDGPVAGYESTLDSQPGRSSVTIVVRDDSVLLNRKAAVEITEGKRADETARKLFAGLPEAGTPRVKSTDSPEPVTVRRGTPIELLRKLALDHGYHAYVLPGEQRGRSIGCFLPDPDAAGKLPPLVLIGDARNVADIEIHESSEAPQRTVAHMLGVGDQQIVAGSTSIKDLELLRPLPALEDGKLAERIVAPADNVREDPAVATKAQTRRASYAYKVSGRVVPGCYAAALAPYERVDVVAGKHPMSGTWLLTKATHRITPSIYTQHFEAKSDSKLEPGSPEAEVSKPGGLSIDISLSFGVI